jgi:hypothetical protein
MDSNSMRMLLAGPLSQFFVKQIDLLGLTCGCGTCLNSETSNYEIAQCCSCLLLLVENANPIVMLSVEPKILVESMLLEKRKEVVIQ